MQYLIAEVVESGKH